MAYVNSGYTDPDWSGSGWFEYAAGPLPPPDAAWNNPRWAASGWNNTRWTDTAVSVGGFQQAGLAGFLDVSGFAGGLPWNEQGITAFFNSQTFFSGFSPDPLGILDNDSDPDGDPLSYTIISQPDAGTLTAYAGGAFDWVIPIGAPDGRYFWTYELFAGGESGGIGTVSMEHGQVFASTGVQGFAGTGIFGRDFQEQGIAGGGILVTGFAGDLLLTFSEQGTSASVSPQGNTSTLAVGIVERGSAAGIDGQGFAGSIIADSFDDFGTLATVDVQGFAGTIDFFAGQGTQGSVDVQGFAGDISAGSFDDQGVLASVAVAGQTGLAILGFNDFGLPAELSIEGGTPGRAATSVQEIIISPLNQRDIVIVAVKDKEMIIV